MTLPTASTRLLLMDEWCLRRAAMEAFLRGWANEKGMSLTAQSGHDLEELLAQAADCRMVVLSVGASFCRSTAPVVLNELRLGCRDLPVVVIADTHSIEEIIDAFMQGVQGFLPTSLEPPVAYRALSFVLAGGTYIPPCVLERPSETARALGELTGRPFGRNRAGGERDKEPPEESDTGGTPDSLNSASAEPDDAGPAGSSSSMGNLTARQVLVLRCLRQGLSNKEIARELDMSEPTVKVHVRQVMKKLGARNRTQAALIATIASTEPPDRHVATGDDPAAAEVEAQEAVEWADTGEAQRSSEDQPRERLPHVAGFKPFAATTEGSAVGQQEPLREEPGGGDDPEPEATRSGSAAGSEARSHPASRVVRLHHPGSH